MSGVLPRERLLAMSGDARVNSSCPSEHQVDRSMEPLFRLSGARRDDPAVTAWFEAGDDGIRRLALHWFDRIRACGPDVVELMHDHQPTACVEDAAFAYVAAYRAHAAVGFFHGADLPDPAGILEGDGKRMRHVKLKWGQPAPDAALEALIDAAYSDIRARLAAGA